MVKQLLRGKMIFILQIAMVVESWTIDFRCHTDKDHPGNFALKQVDDKINASDFTELYLPGFHKNSKTIFLIHGFKSNADKWPKKATNKLFASITEDLNVITVDWRIGARLDLYDIFQLPARYQQAAESTQRLGTQIANFVKSLVNKGYLENVENVHLVGHSLGAQAAGYAGRYFSQIEKVQIGQITGLDPAKPNFEDTLKDWGETMALGRRTFIPNFFIPNLRTPNTVYGIRNTQCLVRISKHDAFFVDIIHTSSLGMNSSAGHVDFYPNGGRKMPSCDNKKTGKKNLCNHSMAHKYWIQSIAETVEYHAYHCDSYAHFNGNCTKTEANRNRMGYHSKKSESRSFYLNTTSIEPYWQPHIINSEKQFLAKNPTSFPSFWPKDWACCGAPQTLEPNISDADLKCGDYKSSKSIFSTQLCQAENERRPLNFCIKNLT